MASRPAWLDVPQDLNELSPKLWSQTASRGPDGQVCVGAKPVTEIVAEYGSPVYVLDEADFRARCRSFARAYSGWDVYYASKAFLTRDIARWAIEEGLNLDVSSGNEMLVAATGGAPVSRMGLHGNNKTVEELRLAIKLGVGRIIVDSLTEIDRINQICAELDKTVRILVRVTPGVEAHTHEYIATSHEDQKFGFSIHNGFAMQALMKAYVSERIELAGLHCHIGSQIFETSGFQVAAKRCIKLMSDFMDATGIQLEELDLGGGYGIAYTMVDNPISIDEMASQMKQIAQIEALAHGLDTPKMSIEPGRAIVGPTTMAVYTVGTVKPVVLEGGATRTYISVDGGMSDNIRPALYGSDYSASLINRRSDADPILCRVVGKHCEGGDIVVKDVFLPADITAGDLIGVPGSGAYCRPMASNYNYATKPAVVAVKDGTVRTLLRRETLDDLLELDQGTVVFTLEGLLE